jgi:hypothetical protein
MTAWTPSGRRLVLAAVAAMTPVWLVGCSQPGNKTASEAASSQGFLQALEAGYTQSFNKTFDKSTHDSCVPAAVTHGASADAAERYCNCVIAQLEPLSPIEKLQLNSQPDKLTAAGAACQAQIQTP